MIRLYRLLGADLSVASIDLDDFSAARWREILAWNERENHPDQAVIVSRRIVSREEVRRAEFWRAIDQRAMPQPRLRMVR